MKTILAALAVTALGVTAAAASEGENRASQSLAKVHAEWDKLDRTETTNPFAAFFGLFDDEKTAKGAEKTAKGAEKTTTN